MPSHKRKVNKKAYLAGPMEYAANAGLDWRLEYRDDLANLEIDVIIPEYEEGGICTQEQLNHLKVHDIESYIRIMRQLITLDLRFVETVDLIVCYWDGERMSGTVGEFQKAYEIGRKTCLVTPRPFIEIPGWFLACSTDRFHTKEELLVHLKEYYHG